MDGTLFLVVGDRADVCARAIESARRRFSSDPETIIPRRAITKLQHDGELHQAVTPAQFDRLRRDGGYALYWSEGGANYGIPAAITRDLAAGHSVIVTVPKFMVEAAVARFPNVQVIEIGTPGRRGRARGRNGEIAGGEDGSDRILAEFDAALARFPQPGLDLRRDKLPA